MLNARILSFDWSDIVNNGFKDLFYLIIAIFMLKFWLLWAAWREYFFNFKNSLSLDETLKFFFLTSPFHVLCMGYLTDSSSFQINITLILINQNIGSETPKCLPRYNCPNIYSQHGYLWWLGWGEWFGDLGHGL